MPGTRGWEAVFYPDSCPDLFLLIEKFKVPALVSPLHDKDQNPDGTFKKEHFHVYFDFDGPKPATTVLNQLWQVFDKSMVSYVEPVKSWVGCIDYCSHTNAIEKAQYSSADISCYCGFNLEEKYTASPSERLDYLCDMIDYIDNNDIYEYWQFLRYCRYNNREWFKILCSNGSYVISNAITSKRNSRVLENLGE